MTLFELTKKFKSKNTLLHYFFPYTSEKLLGPCTTKYLDVLYFDLFKKLKIHSLIECGAYEATASLEAIKRGCNAIAIEANPNTFKKITPKTNEKLTSINCGLSEKEGYLNFYYPKKNNTEVSSTFQKKAGMEYNTVKILTKPLDKIVKNFDIISKPFTLWIDVEGFQKQVLFGARNVLKNNNCKFLKIEVEKVEKFKGQLFLSKEIEEFLYKFDFIPVFRDFEYDYQFNILFIKKDYYNQVSSQIESMIKKTILNSIDLFKILRLISNRKIFILELKTLIIRLFGEKIGNYFASILGSKSSAAFIKRKQSTVIND